MSYFWGARLPVYDLLCAYPPLYRLPGVVVSRVEQRVG